VKSRLWLISLPILLAVSLAAQAQAPQQALPLIATGRYIEAQQILAPYLAQHPEDLASRYWYGRALLGVGQRAAAVDEFRAILVKKPDSLDTRVYLAQALYELRQTDEAKVQLAEVLRRSPDYAPATHLLDQIDHNLGALGPAPPELSGGRIAFVNGGLPVDPGDLSLESYNVKDYTFSTAPRDWLITSGTWATTNRWMCQPQWSWYGGFANNAPAAIWTKEEFSGDMEVEEYLCYKMGTDVVGRPYKNPNDMCISLCGDGGNLDSGYSFILGAEHNTATRIMRGDKVLAQTTDPANLLPSWANGQPSLYRWHRHWWALRARKVGDLLQFYMDEHLMLEVHDPNPLEQGRVALWTYDNGIIIPRVKIYYQQTVRPRSEPAGQDAWINPVTQVAPQPLMITSSSHSAITNDFEYSLGSWRNLDATADSDPLTGALLTIVPGGPSGTGHCLALMNRTCSGDFGAMISQPQLDARHYSRLAFDYKLPPEAKLNFYLASGGKWYEIVFSGLESPAPQATLLGRIPGVLADNQWHHAEFDLLGALEAAIGSPEHCLFQDLHVANFNPTGYLMAGFGGNPAGCTWYLDNFYLGAPSHDRTLLVDVKPAAGVTPTGFAYSVDQNPQGAATGAPSAAAPTQVAATGPGQWYLHVRATQALGPSSVVTFPFRVADAAPRVASTVPADGASLGGGEIVLKLDPDAGVDPSSVKLEVNGQLLTAGSPGVRVDCQAPAIHLDPAAAGVSLKPGAALQVRLTALTDHAGGTLATPQSFTYHYAPAPDAAAPVAPVLTLAQPDLTNANAENHFAGVTVWGAADETSLALDPTTAATPGKSSLRVTDLTTGGVFGVNLAPHGFDAGKYRLLSFDYNLQPGVLLSLLFSMDGQWYALNLTDTDPVNPIGKIDGAVADGQWHHAELDLYQLLRQRDPQRTSYVISQLVFGDSGWLGNSKNAFYHLDNVRLASVVSARDGLSVAWKAPALGGVDTVGYTLDTSPATATTDATAPAQNPVVLPAVASFDGYLHLRVRDSAGRWSPVSTRRLLVDSSQPTATILEPAADTHAAPRALRLHVASPGLAGIDPQSLVLSVAGKDYRVDSPALVFSAGSGELAWYPDRVTPSPIVFPNGQVVDVELKQAADFAGNPVAAKPHWSWTMDYSQDTVGPTIDQFVSPSHPTFMSNTFEDGSVGTVAGLKNAEVRVVPSDAPSGGKCLLVHKTGPAPLAVRLLETPFSSDKYPLLAFDYKCGPNVHFNVVAQMGNQRFVWAFSGPVAGTVGWVSNVKLDGQWHHAVVRLAAPAVNAQDPAALIVQGVYLYEQQEGEQLPVGGEFMLDNLLVGAGSSGPIVARWHAGDPTGVQGYSYVLTQDPAAMPPDQILDTQSSHRFDAVAGGLWFLRLKAEDGAGNWGPVYTYTLLSTSPK